MARGEDGTEQDTGSALANVRRLAGEWDGANSDEGYPAERVARLAEAGALSAFTALDGEAAVRDLGAALRLVGGADLSLGRIWEGHINAAQLVHAYGDPGQRAALARDLEAGRVFGVWNTEPAPGMRIEPAAGGRRRLSGAKSFATGAGHLDRALITARDGDGAKRMVLVDMAGLDERADLSGWRVRGMRGTVSGVFDFDRIEVGEEALIGGPNDYEREPRFTAGAWRFCAVQLGAAEALVRHLRDHLLATGKADDPLQRARFGAAATGVRSAGCWVARAAQIAERGEDDAVPLALMTRGVVEDACLRAMEAAARGAGTAAFFEGSRIDRISRDLGLYLRQPFPDGARDRAVQAWLQRDRWGEDPWW